MKYLLNNNYGLDSFLGSFLDGTNFGKFPPVDILENDKSFVVEVELPGYSQDEVSIVVDQHVLKISSDKKEEEKEKYHIKERFTTSFERSFSLPENIDEEKIDATFKNGLLTIEMPKYPVEEPKKIDVQIK